MTFKTLLTDYICASFAGLWVETQEAHEAQRQIAALVASHPSWTMTTWDCAKGEWDAAGKGRGDPLAPLQPVSHESETHIVVLWNYHLFIKTPLIIQTFQHAILRGKAERTIYVILSPTVAIPMELEHLFTVVTHDLPDQDDLHAIAKDISVTNNKEASEAATGLTRVEAENSFSLSYIRNNGNLSAREVWEIKAATLKKTGLLTIYDGNENFSSIGGLHALKKFAKHALEPNPHVKPKGIMLLGVSGTGKSAFAKALGNETGRKVLAMDIGSLMGSHVGETEQKLRRALQVADAMQPCILFIDEIEKALAGATSEHQGDNGVKAGILGALLTWMQDHTTDVFVVCTSNNIQQLPPEFTRAERFDAVFFIDLPGPAERRQIWNIYLDISPDPMIDDTTWTGAEIKACCRLAHLLIITTCEASRYIVPVASTAGDKISALRQWASGKCLDANEGGIYQANKATTKRRQIAKV